MRLDIRGGAEGGSGEGMEGRSDYQRMGEDTMKWAMDSFFNEERMATEQKRGMVFATGNVRRIKKPGITLRTAEMQQHMWECMGWAEADVVGLADTGLDRKAGKAGQYSTHHSSGRAARAASVWGGEKLRWTMEEGMRGKRGATAQGEVEQGVVLAAAEAMRMRCDVEIKDQRGWGRFGGFTIKGVKGCKDVMVVEVMLPPEGSAMWTKQKEEMEVERAKGKQGVASNPREQAYTDMFKELSSSLESGAAVIMMGDFNDGKHRQHKGGALATMGGLMEALGLVDAVEERRKVAYKEEGIKEEDCWTYEARGQGGRLVRTRPDHILVSESIKNLVTRVGILQGGPDAAINNSDHRFVFMEIELMGVLGWSATQERMVKRVNRRPDPMLRMDDDDKIRKYHKEVELRWVEKGMEEGIQKLEEVVRSRKERGVEWGTDENFVQQEMDQVMDNLVEVLKEAEAVVVPRVAPGKKPQRKKKKSVTAEVKVKAQNVRRLLYLEKLYKEKPKHTVMQEGRRIEKARNWGGLGTPTDARQWQRDREQWIARVRAKKVEEMQAMRKLQKKAYEDNQKGAQKWLAKKLAEQRWGQIFKATKGTGGAEVDRDCVVVNEGTAKEPVMVAKTTKEEVNEAQDKYFAQWFGEGYETWHQKWDKEGKPCFTHVLFRDG